MAAVGIGPGIGQCGADVPCRARAARDGPAA